jgi:transposase
MARKGTKQNVYTDELIRQVITKRLEQGRSYNYLEKKYGIPRGTIKTWVHKYRQRGTVARQQRGRPKRDKGTDYKEKYEILKKYLEFLEEVEHEKK